MLPYFARYNEQSTEEVEASLKSIRSQEFEHEITHTPVIDESYPSLLFRYAQYAFTVGLRVKLSEHLINSLPEIVKHYGEEHPHLLNVYKALLGLYELEHNFARRKEFSFIR